MSAWIKMIKDHEANQELKEVFNLARTPHGPVDNVINFDDRKISYKLLKEKYKSQ